MAHKPAHAATKDTTYSKKLTAGRVIGLQNLLPHFAEDFDTVFFTDNHMVAQLYEVDATNLRQKLS